MSLRIVFRVPAQHEVEEAALLKRPLYGTTNNALGLVKSSSEKLMRPCFEQPLTPSDIRLY